MARRGKFAWEYVRCTAGVTVAHPVRCAACDAGPLHPNTNKCGCSFWRQDALVCRRCALGFDLLTRGSSRIDNGWTSSEVRDLLDLLDRGGRVKVVTR